MIDLTIHLDPITDKNLIFFLNKKKSIYTFREEYESSSSSSSNLQLEENEEVNYQFNSLTYRMVLIPQSYQFEINAPVDFYQLIHVHNKQSFFLQENH